MTALYSILKANLKDRKGNFISLFLLIFIVALSLTTIISVSSGTSERLAKACKDSNSADIISLIPEDKCTAAMLQGLRQAEQVASLEQLKLITCPRFTISGQSPFNSYFFTAYEPEQHSYQFYNNQLSGFLKDNTVKPEAGEVYAPVTLQDLLHCNIGDEITITTNSGTFSYRIARFIEDPLTGSSSLGMKFLFMNEADFQKLYALKDKETVFPYNQLNLYIKDNDKDSLNKVKRDLNEQTGFISNGTYTFLKAEVNSYTLLFTSILSGILYSFAVLLFIIILIIIGHSVSTSIEMDYVLLGILKSQGFTSLQLRSILILQYLLPGILGSAFGIAASKLVIRYLDRIFLPITGLLISDDIKFVKSIGLLLLLLFLITAYTFIKTKKVAGVSPVQAISAGHAPVYFSGRINFSIANPIALSLGIKMALKNITGRFKNYLSTVLIMAILAFFTISVTSLNQMANLHNSDALFGTVSSDITVYFNSEESLAQKDGIASLIESRFRILREFQMDNMYFAVDNMDYLGHIVDSTDTITKLVKGRRPKYDNEIVITQIMSAEIGKDIGDTVSIQYGNAKADYMIAGINQNISDVGKNFFMLSAGMQRLSPDYSINNMDYCISDQKMCPEIISLLQETYKNYGDDLVFVDAYQEAQDSNRQILAALDAITAITYTLAIIFAAIVALMISQKAFSREKQDLGILKSVGFTTFQLRGQFTLRFLTIVLIGSLVGMGANFLWNNALMSLLLRSMGIADFITQYSVYNILIPIACICLFTLIFSWAVSGKIKRVSPKSLIQE